MSDQQARLGPARPGVARRCRHGQLGAHTRDRDAQHSQARPGFFMPSSYTDQEVQQSSQLVSPTDTAQRARAGTHREPLPAAVAIRTRCTDMGVISMYGCCTLISSKLGVTWRTVQRWLLGERCPSLAHIWEMAHMVGVDGVPDDVVLDVRSWVCDGCAPPPLWGSIHFEHGRPPPPHFSDQEDGKTQ